MLDGYPTIELIDVVYNRIIENDTELTRLRAALDDVTRQLQEHTEALQSVTLEPANEYTPWVELGVTELEYFRRQYLGMSGEHEKLLTGYMELIEWQAHIENLYPALDFEEWRSEHGALSVSIVDLRAENARLTAENIASAKNFHDVVYWNMDGWNHTNQDFELCLHDDCKKARAARVQAAAPGTGEA